MLQALTVRVNIVGELGMFLCRKLTSNQCRSKDLKKTAFFVGGEFYCNQNMVTFLDCIRVINTE